jgi:hypothetical protein
VINRVQLARVTARFAYVKLVMVAANEETVFQKRARSVSDEDVEFHVAVFETAVVRSPHHGLARQDLILAPGAGMDFVVH